MTTSDANGDSLDTILSQLAAGYRRSGWHRDVHLASAFHDAISRRATGNITFLDDDQTVNRAELWQDALALAASLRTEGLLQGQKVGLQLPNSRRSWTLYLACLVAGAVIVAIPPTFRSAEVAYCLQDSEATWFFVADRWRNTDFTADLGRIRSAPRLEKIVVVGGEVPDDCSSFGPIESRAADAASPQPLVYPAGGGDPCMVCYTSGSTSDPKGVVHTHNSLLAEMDQLAARTDPSSVTLTARPLGMIAGMLSLLGALYMAVDTVVMDRWDAERAIDVIASHGITRLGTVPFILTTLLEQAESRGRSLAQLREVTCGGSSVTPSLVERAELSGLCVYRLYGSSEHPTTTSGHWMEPTSVRATTDGLVLPGVSLRVIAQDGTDAGIGEEGEIVTRGPEQFVGYTDPEATLAAFTSDGWLKSGDLGFLDPSGRLTVAGRKKELIIRAGINLSPVAIEDVLARHPAVQEVAVVGVSDPNYGERPAAFVLLRPGHDLSPDQVRAHFDWAGVARQKTPEFLVVRDELPRTPGGKVAKQRLRREFDANRTELGAPNPDADVPNGGNGHGLQMDPRGRGASP